MSAGLTRKTSRPRRRATGRHTRRRSARGSRRRSTSSPSQWTLPAKTRRSRFLSSEPERSAGTGAGDFRKLPSRCRQRSAGLTNPQCRPLPPWRMVKRAPLFVSGCFTLPLRQTGPAGRGGVSLPRIVTASCTTLAAAPATLLLLQRVCGGAGYGALAGSLLLLVVRCVGGRDTTARLHDCSGGSSNEYNQEESPGAPGPPPRGAVVRALSSIGRAKSYGCGGWSESE